MSQYDIVFEYLINGSLKEIIDENRMILTNERYEIEVFYIPFIPNGFYDHIGEKLSLHIMIEAEHIGDSLSGMKGNIYGYAETNVARYIFERLTSINGVGIKAACEIYKEFYRHVPYKTVEAIENAAKCRNVDAFLMVNGVGAKTAERICNEIGNTYSPQYINDINYRLISLDDSMTDNAGGNGNYTGSNNKKDEFSVKSEAAVKLDKLIGLENVKKEVREITNLAKVQMQRKKMGLPSATISYHLVFTGNPGTGKTTVARIISEIYKEIGVLSKGHVIETDRSGLVAGYVGQTAIQTKEIIDKAKGGVLFIDEAYTLLGEGKDYGQEAIDTLLKEMEDNRDDLVVIVAGYDDPMKKFIGSNPGLQSRFNRYIHFDDYSGEQLFSIFNSLCEKNQYCLSDGCETELLRYFNQLSEKHDSNFGNARDVRNFFESVITRQSNRISSMENVSKADFEQINIEDLGIESAQNNTLDEMIRELELMTGLSMVKNEVNSLIKLVQYKKLRESQGLAAPPVSLHLVFTGNPGTGKTTVARIIAKIYKELGLITKGQLIETDRSGLVAGYVGQTAIKTKEVISSAIGGVLFIDEAYTLVGEGNDYGQEAIDTLLKEMEDHRDNLIVIVAGYTEEMFTFINSNPGLESRFNRYLQFEDYSPEEMVSIFEGMCNKNQYKLEDDARERIFYFFKSTDSAKIGNGRGVRNVFEKIVTYHAEKFSIDGSGLGDDLSIITKEDVEKAIE